VGNCDSREAETEEEDVDRDEAVERPDCREDEELGELDSEADGDCQE